MERVFLWQGNVNLAHHMNQEVTKVMSGKVKQSNIDAFIQ